MLLSMTAMPFNLSSPEYLSHHRTRNNRVSPVSRASPAHMNSPLVELPSLVAKCCTAWKIWRRKVCKFVYICITRGKIYHFSAKIVSKVVTFSSRNTNVYKFANFARPYFPCFTTFRHQTWQFYY